MIHKAFGGKVIILGLLTTCFTGTKLMFFCRPLQLQYISPCRLHCVFTIKTILLINKWYSMHFYAPSFLCFFSLAAMIFSVPTSLHKKTLEINYEVQNWLCYVDSLKGYVSVANQRSVDKKRKTIASIRKYCTIFFLYWPWIASTFYVSLMGKPATEATLCNTGSVLWVTLAAKTT